MEASNGKAGIVSGINKKTINVQLVGGIGVQGPPEGFKKSNLSFEEARSRRDADSKDEWSEGDSGYLKTADGIAEVVVGKTSGGKTKLYRVNGNGGHYALSQTQLRALSEEDRSQRPF